MANCAYYKMKVTGKKADVNEFIEAMNFEGKYKDNGPGRIYVCDVYESGEIDDEYYIVCDGECAWSIDTAMLNPKLENNIRKLSEKLNLKIEAYSEEVGFEFQEHIFIDNGKIQQYRCVDYHEVYIDNIDDELWEEPWIIKNNINKQNYEEFIVDEYLKVGGFSTWDWKHI